MKLVPGFLMIFFLVTSYAQNSIKISGRVLDSDSNQPLEYASISLKHHPIGTITNAEGRFDLFISSELSVDTVMISFLGYSPQYLPASVMAASPGNIIKLKPKVLTLQEVVVTDNMPTGLEIITKAFNNVEANYPIDPYVYAGFIRESWTQNKKTVSLVESAVDIYDDGYRKSKRKGVRVREKVFLKFARASDNYMNDSFKPLLNRYNALTSALRWNQVKYPHPDITRDITGKEVILDNVIYSNDRVLYVVSFITHSDQNALYERKDTYYIDDKDFAIKKIEWREYSRNGTYRGLPGPIDNERSYQARDVVTVYEFEDYKGKMYLKYVKEHGEGDIFNTKTKVVEYQVEGDMIFVVTDIREKDDGKAPKDTMDHGKSLSLQTTPYDGSFWSDYRQVKLVPLTDKQLKDLEEKESLSKQFARSGIK